MANLDEPNGNGGAEQNGPETPTRDTLQERVRELERENAKLAAELAALRTRHQRDRELLDAVLLSGLPATEAEWRKMVAEGVEGNSFIGELIASLEGRDEPAAG